MKSYTFKTDLNKMFPYCGDVVMERLVNLIKVNHKEIGVWEGNVFHHSTMIKQQTQGLVKGYAIACLHFQVEQE